MRPFLYKNSTHPVITLSHSARKIVRRVGTGISPEELTQRAWKKKSPVPKHWYFPRRKGCVYFRYGDVVFAFGMSWDASRINCITVFGPFRPDGSWWEHELFKRT